jgi:hypothetical protein
MAEKESGMSSSTIRLAGILALATGSEVALR